MPFLRSYRGPALAELGHPDVASGRDSYAFGFSRVLAWARYALPPLLQGTRPRFSSGTLMSLPEGIATPAGP